MKEKFEKLDVKIYEHTDLPRKIEFTAYQRSNLNEQWDIVRREIVKRGYKVGETRTGDIINTSSLEKEVDSKIFLKKKLRDYSVNNLSLLEFIECLSLEGPAIETDIVKIDLLLTLIKKYDIFKNSDKALTHYRKRGLELFTEEKWKSEIGIFLDDIQFYILDIGKLVVTEYKHDFLINKEIGEEPTLLPMEGYDKKFEYFFEIPYHFL